MLQVVPLFLKHFRLDMVILRMAGRRVELEKQRHAVGSLAGRDEPTRKGVFLVGRAIEKAKLMGSKSYIGQMWR